MLKLFVGVAFTAFALQSAHALEFDKEGLAKIQQAAKEEMAAASNKELKLPTGKCLDVAGDVNAAGTNVQMFDCNGAVNQKWRLDGGRLVNQGGKCLDVAGDVNAAGTNVQIFDCNDAINQKWHFDGGRLMNDGGKCLDTAGDVNAVGVNVQIFDCNDAPNQKWSF